MPYAARRRATPRHVGRPVRRPPVLLTLSTITLVCAAHLSWEFLGTNWIARGQQRHAISALEKAWDRRSPSVTSGGVAIDGIIRIPRFGSAYVVPLVEGSGPASLSLGVGHVAGSARPGAPGNVVLAGHRVTHGEPFRRLSDLRVGDQVILETSASRFVYRITGHGWPAQRVDETATWVLASHPRDPGRGGVVPPRSARVLTLVTCAELFHTSARLVVFGELVHSSPRVRTHPQA